MRAPLENKNKSFDEALLSQSIKTIVANPGQASIQDALIAGATLIQGMVLSRQGRELFHQAIDYTIAHNPSAAARGALAEMVDLAVNFQLRDDGSRLGLWLLPVEIDSDSPEALATQLRLPPQGDSLTALKARTALMDTLGLPHGQGAWTVTLDSIYSFGFLQNADVGELIHVPQRALAAAQGGLTDFQLTEPSGTEPAKPGKNLYYLPFVANHPAGAAIIDVQDVNEKVKYLITKWVTPALPAGSKVTVHAPAPFSTAIEHGEAFAAKKAVSDLLDKVMAESGVQPAGLHATVAAYQLPTDDDSTMVGVSFMTLLDEAHFVSKVIAMTETPAKANTKINEIVANLREFGVSCTVMTAKPLRTGHCQHCGEIQFAHPRFSSPSSLN